MALHARGISSLVIFVGIASCISVAISIGVFVVSNKKNEETSPTATLQSPKPLGDASSYIQSGNVLGDTTAGTCNHTIQEKSVDVTPTPTPLSCVESEQTNPSFIIQCGTGNGQNCSTPHSFTVNTTGTSWIKINYTTHASHCSNVAVKIYVDDVYKTQSNFIAALQSTGSIDLETVAAGTHTIKLYGVGQAGGCNDGNLVAWGGSLTTTITCP